LYRVPVTTLVGYYDPDYSIRNLESYIYPAMHGAYGFVFNDDDNDGTTTADSTGCELVVITSNNGSLVFDLSTSIDSSSGMMNKFHINVATDDEPYEANVYCQNVLLATRALEGPNSEEPPLRYTVTGVQFNIDDDDDDEEPTESPTATPTESPTESCANQEEFLWKNKPNKNCQWAEKGSTKKKQKKCRRKNSDGTNVAFYCRKTCAKVGVGPCK